MDAKVELTADEIERLGPILDYAAAECGVSTAAAVLGVRALLEERGATTYAYADLRELLEVLEEVQADRCPVDQDTVAALLAKF